MLYELTYEYQVHGQTCQNKFNYATPLPGEVPGGAEPLSDSFIAFVGVRIRNLLSLAVDFTRVYTRAIYDVTDFHEEFTVLTGDRAGDAMPPFVALAFRTDRIRTDMRRGYKRFAGVSETDVTGNNFIGGGQLLTDVSTGLLEALDWSPAPTDYFTPVILGKLYQQVPGSNPPRYEYVYYPTEAAQRGKMYTPTVWGFQRLTTQRSRISGQGV